MPKRSETEGNMSSDLRKGIYPVPISRIRRKEYPLLNRPSSQAMIISGIAANVPGRDNVPGSCRHHALSPVLDEGILQAHGDEHAWKPSLRVTLVFTLDPYG